MCSEIKFNILYWFWNHWRFLQSDWFAELRFQYELYSFIRTEPKQPISLIFIDTTFTLYIPSWVHKTAIINSSFTTSTLPDPRKIAEIPPWLKDGVHKVRSNTRPFSMFNVVSKLREKLALNQFCSFFKSHCSPFSTWEWEQKVLRHRNT